jgi:hypothetical protein
VKPKVFGKNDITIITNGDGDIILYAGTHEISHIKDITLTNKEVTVTFDRSGDLLLRKHIEENIRILRMFSFIKISM